MHAQDIYIKLVDPTGSKAPVINYHRVWDKDLFVAAQKRHYEIQAEGTPEYREVFLTSEAEYKRINYK